MFELHIESAKFTDALNRYQKLTGLGMSEVIRSQARLLADRLVKLTYPSNAAQGKRKVEADMGKVFLKNTWFSETFQFTNKRLGERVKDAVRSKKATELEAIFSHSSRLSKLKIESFDKARHKAARRDGRVYYKAPYSFPLAEQKQVASYLKEKKAAVGTAKAGWAMAGAAVGGKLPSWLSKSNVARVEDNSKAAVNPSVTMTNKTAVFAAIDAKSNVTQRALAGRSRDMIKAAERALKQAQQGAGL